MLPKLSKSEHTRAELDRWSAAAKGIKDKTKKQEVFDKISFIKKKLAEIDDYHSTYNTGAIHPRALADVREELYAARQEVDKIIKSHLGV